MKQKDRIDKLPYIFLLLEPSQNSHKYWKECANFGDAIQRSMSKGDYFSHFVKYR